MWFRELFVCLFDRSSKHYTDEEFSKKKPSSLKATAGILSKNPGLISLGGGLPSSDYFPIERLAIKVPSVPNFSEEDTRVSGKMLEVGKHDVSEGIGAYGECCFSFKEKSCCVLFLIWSLLMGGILIIYSETQRSVNRTQLRSRNWFCTDVEIRH